LAEGGGAQALTRTREVQKGVVASVGWGKGRRPGGGGPNLFLDMRKRDGVCLQTTKGGGGGGDSGGRLFGVRGGIVGFEIKERKEKCFAFLIGAGNREGEEKGQVYYALSKGEGPGVNYGRGRRLTFRRSMGDF